VRKLFWTLIGLAAVGVFLFLLAPPAPVRVDQTGWTELAARTVAGAYHVHSTRSDGHGDKAAIAAAAARAGVRFVVLTDHGDGTRPPDPPEYLDGVLMLDAVEISTADGHYVALHMRRAPYPLGGSAESVVEDVKRLDGLGIAAHPDSPKPSLRWTDTTSPIDGIEWLNADSEWRDESRGALVEAGVGYFFRPAAALASLLDRPVTLDRWDGLLRQWVGRQRTDRADRPVLALGASDAHGGAGRRAEDQSRTLFSTIGIPSYEASFRELSIRVVVDTPLSGDARADAAAIYQAIDRGRVYTVVDALATGGLLDFRIESRFAGPPHTLLARAAMPAGAQIVLIGPAGEIARSSEALRRPWPNGLAERPARDWERVEVRLPGAPGRPPIPWLVSNPIVADPPGPSRTVDSTRNRLPRIAPFPWRIEKDPASSAVLRSGSTAAELQYRLAPGARNSQYVALATDVHEAQFSAIDLDLASDRPVRLGVQIRTADGRRWGRTYYVPGPLESDPAQMQEALVHAPLVDLEPIGGGIAPPPSREVSSILLVADLTNALPGQGGTVTILASALVK
jgi:hypothetical protein